MCACGRNKPLETQTTLQVEQQRLADLQREANAIAAEEASINSARAALANASSDG